MNRSKMVRQGDVLVMLTRETVITPRHKQVFDSRGTVLAEGEATGHHHRIKLPGTALLRAEGISDAVLTVGRDMVALLEHEEHASIEIAGGTYIVRQQQQYDWALNKHQVMPVKD